MKVVLLKQIQMKIIEELKLRHNGHLLQQVDRCKKNLTCLNGKLARLKNGLSISERKVKEFGALVQTIVVTGFPLLWI
jgi:hypothetical protein